MSLEEIQATGYLLTSYHSDLTYIKNFQLYKQQKINATDFVKKKSGTFYKFLIEFRVARNFKSGYSNSILQITTEWINGNNPDDVDAFAAILNKDSLTHEKTMTSLASKILFLNNPWAITPLDRWAKKAVNQKMSDNNFSRYLEKVNQFKDDNKEAIKLNLQIVEPLLTRIESDFKKELQDIQLLRQNRFTDKLLWVTGQAKPKKGILV